MTPRPRQPKALAGVVHLSGVLFRCLASLRLAVLLLVVLAVLLACTTVVEALRGTEYVQWYVYHGVWFIALLVILAANVLAAALVRFPWKRRHLGFLSTHLGVLVLLGGSLQTFVGGIEGRLPFAEGDTADKIVIRDRSLLKAVLHGEHGPASTEFAFSAGPFDWPEGKTLEFGQAEGIGLTVLRFYRHAVEEVSWVPGASGLGSPALEFAFHAPGGKTISQQWLAGSQLGGDVEIGPADFKLLTTSVDSMVGDFLDPPLAGAGDDGVLSMCYEDQVFHVDVKGNVGKKVPLGETGASVEIVEHLADAVVGTADRLVSRGTEPRNPMLDLLAHLPGRDEPIRQVAFARFPALNLDRSHGRTCPVKFWYYHPAFSAEPGAEFLQAPDGRLYCRVGAGGEYLSRGEVKRGDRIETWAGFSVSILQYVPHARREVSFLRVPGTGEDSPGLEAAALVELSLDDETEQVWIQRNGQERMIQTPEGVLVLTFAYDQLPLGFSLKLLDFKHGLNPGRVGDASFASSVQLVDSARGLDEKRKVSMNNPLVHDKFTFYQSSFNRLGDGRDVSILSVSHDPGRFLKYLGSLMVCVGTFVVFYMRRHSTREGSSSVSKKPPRSDGQAGTDEAGGA